MLTSTCSRERNLYISSFSLADRELLFQRLGSRWRSVSTLELSGAITAPSTKKEKRSIAAASEPLPRESRGESAVKVCPTGTDVSLSRARYLENRECWFRIEVRTLKL